MTSDSMAPAVLITGASSGIGAEYADRFARRGHDVILVARDQDRLRAMADRLNDDYGVTADVLRADLTDPADLARVEDRLRSDDAIRILVNDAGVSSPGAFATLGVDRMAHMIALNVTAPTRLTAAVIPRLAATGPGSVITVSSMVSLIPDYGQSVFGSWDKNQAVYGATKSYLLYLSRSLHDELAEQGVYLQAVVPAATRTRVFERTGREDASIPGLMDAGDFVDAALVGFDRREAVTMPSLADAGRWVAYDDARSALVADIAHEQPATRYRMGS